MSHPDELMPEVHGDAFSTGGPESQILAERGAQLLLESGNEEVADETIHIVDDDCQMRQVIADMVAHTGARTQTYASASDFVAEYVSGSPGCLITDLRMPGMDGLSLVRRLKQTAATLPVIVVTGSGDIQAAIEAMHLSAVDVLLKPFDRERLCLRVQQSLELNATRREHVKRREAARVLLNRLTDREREVLELIVEGLTNRQIAIRTQTSEKIIEAHRVRIARKLLARNDFDVARVTRDGIALEPEVRPQASGAPSLPLTPTT